MPDDAPVTRTVRPGCAALTQNLPGRTYVCLPPPSAGMNGGIFGVSEGSRTPDLQDHNLAL